ncbi:MAG: hypothetical protein IRZ31_19630 [Thermogemmatispora sp.]|jgi:hypothetical protein|uniref:hypothetical protein n=1 Tax=Thermogemmatispora sp. TaxID=1968838 RepID=UPI0026230E07|nr:hypothetical protein [Thermogemmatispora sp.]MBX5459110.1 hypothetical protein [Thermogemmatispora sp.]
MSRRFAYRPRYFSLSRRQIRTLSRNQRAFFPRQWPARQQPLPPSRGRNSFPQPHLPFSPFVHSLTLPQLPPLL